MVMVLFYFNILMFICRFKLHFKSQWSQTRPHWVFLKTVIYLMASWLFIYKTLDNLKYLIIVLFIYNSIWL